MIIGLSLFRDNRLSNCMHCSVESESKPLVGSSSSRIEGENISSKAIDNLLLCPPLQWPTEVAQHFSKCKSFMSFFTFIRQKDSFDWISLEVETNEFCLTIFSDNKSLIRVCFLQNLNCEANRRDSSTVNKSIRKSFWE